MNKCESKDIINLLEKLAPERYAEKWDNVGLLVGRKGKKVTNIMLALDASDEVIEQAIHNKVDLLITHHPLIFSPMNKVTTEDFIGRRVYELIANDISYFAMHTNFDVMAMADAAADKIGIINTIPLEVTNIEKLYKIVVYVPKDDADKVRTSLTSAGAGHIGEYSHCTYNIEGIGTYKPLEGTNPYIGTVNEISDTKEIRIETIVKEKDLNKVIKNMIEAHPYEEVAYDVFELVLDGKVEGIGRVGVLNKAITLDSLAKLVKDRFQIKSLRVVGNMGKEVNKIAISTGAGKSMVEQALSLKADVLITGDIDYHTAIDAKARGLAIIDAGHFETEHFMTEYVKEYLHANIKQLEEKKIETKSLRIIIAEEETPYQFV